MPVKRKPLVQNNFLVSNHVETKAEDPVQIGSRAWYDWLKDHHGFTYKGEAGCFTARLELRRGIGYWYAYRRRDGKLSKTYLGKSEDLTQERLKQASTRLAGQKPLELGLRDDHLTDNIAIPNPQDGYIADKGPAATSLPLTKTIRPAFPHNLITRPRLSKKINTPVTLICAPSGFGKSTVLNEWRENLGMPVAWVNLDPEDNNPQLFWSIIVTAFQTINPSVGQNWISLLYTSSASALTQIVISLTNDIVHVIDEPKAPRGIVLVLDNYHHIQSPEIHTSLQLFLKHVPPKLNLVIVSQTKPPLDLGLFRSKGMVGELGVDDLRFTLEEGIDFLSQHPSGINLAYGDMQKLVKRTEGWIAGMVLVLNAMAQEKEPSKFIERFTGAHSYLKNFFTENILKQQPLEVQRFLIKTSILNCLSEPICNAVMGENNSAEILAQLWEDRLFLERLEEKECYRYHGLFSEMLHVHLKEQFHDIIPGLHQRAAEWYTANDGSTEAVDHLLGSESWEEAADLIESIALHVLEKSGEGPRLLRWFQRLPEPILYEHRSLLILYLRLAMLSLPPSKVESLLTHTEGSLASISSIEVTNKTRETLSEIHQIHHLWVTNRKPGYETTPLKKYDFVYRLMDDILIINRNLNTRDLIQVEAKATDVLETARSRGHLYGMLIAGGTCANLAFSQGHLRRSEQIAHQVLQQATKMCGSLPEPASIVLTVLSGVYFERNQLAQANRLLERAIEVDPNPINTNEPILMKILRAKIQSTQGDHGAAFATIQAVRELYANRPSSIWLDQDLAAYQALFCLTGGDLTSAEHYLGEGLDIETHPFSAFVRASILAEQSRNVAAEDILRQLLDRYPQGFYWVPVLRVQAKLADVLFNQHKVNQASKVMAEAARLAAPEFFVRPFLFQDPQIASLLSLVLHTENLDAGTRSFLKGTLTMLGYPDGRIGILPREESETLAIAASITPREQQVLRRLSVNLSNMEIAEQCSISVHTVKTHLENIYRKLGVNNRTDAILKARILNLV